MIRYLAFLRGVNLGRRRIKMDVLRELFTQLEFSRVETFIASGNVIFDSAAVDVGELEKRIERRLQDSLGYSVDVILRTSSELARIAAHRPFAGEEIEKPGWTVYVSFLRDAPSKVFVEKLPSLQTSMDALELQGRELYWLCRGRSVDSMISWPKLEKTLATSSTLRNVTTVRKLAAKYPPD